MIFSLLALVIHIAAPTELAAYVRSGQLKQAWQVQPSPEDRTELSLASGYWHGSIWRHSLVIVHPASEDRRHTAILMITGDRVYRNPDPDIEQARDLAKRSHFPVAVLFNVPNQPTSAENPAAQPFPNGSGPPRSTHSHTDRGVPPLREDDLIAWTFEQYLKTGDPSWNLLFPMTRSAVRAMDAVVDVTKSSKNPIRKFVVTGESKRGWTTWLVGAVNDPRVIGIVPVSFDFLNIPAQLKRQVELWGKLSEMLASYTSKGLDQLVGSEPGKRLLELVDPFSYRRDFILSTSPILVVRGSNDPYWATDAGELYESVGGMHMSRLVLPNEGHDFRMNVTYLSTVAAFSRYSAGLFKWPYRMAPFLKGSGADGWRNRKRPDIWLTFAARPDFRKLKWVPHPLTAEYRDDVPNDKWFGMFVNYSIETVDHGGVRDTFVVSTGPLIFEPRGKVNRKAAERDYRLAKRSYRGVAPSPKWEAKQKSGGHK